MANLSHLDGDISIAEDPEWLQSADGKLARDTGIYDLSTEKLQSLLNDHDAFLVFFDSLSSVKLLRQSYVTARGTNNEIATVTLNHRENYEKLHTKVLRPDPDPEPGTIASKLNWDPKMLMEERIDKLDNEADEVAKEFLSGDQKDVRETEAWIGKYRALRKRSHLLAAELMLIERGRIEVEPST